MVKGFRSNEKMMSAPSCILYDLDGTLADTYELLISAYNHVASEFVGRTFTPGEIEAMFGPPEGKIIAKWVPSEKLDEAMDSYYRYYADNHHLVKEFVGIREALSLASSKGIKRGVITGKGRTATDITLGKLGLGDFLDVVITGDDVERPKPNPEGILLAVQRLVTKPKESVFIGDSEVDIRAGKNAGVVTGAAMWVSGYKEELLINEPDLVFRTVKELRRWIELF